MNSRMVPLAIPSEAIHPAHGSGVAIAQQVEQAAALGSLSELCADAGDAFIPDDLIKPEASFSAWVRWCSMVAPKGRGLKDASPSGHPTEQIAVVLVCCRHATLFI
jgi:hypothetical protein